MLRYVEIAALALIAIAGVYMLVEATRWDLQARLFPWVIAIPLVLFAVAQLIATARAGVLKSSATSQSAAADALVSGDPRAYRETGRLAAWIAVFMLCIVLLSFPIGLPVATFLYLKFESRESWRLSLLLGGITLAYLYLIFDYGLHLPWPEGLLTGLLNPN